MFAVVMIWPAVTAIPESIRLPATGNVPTFTLTSGDLNQAVEAVLSVVNAVAAS